MFKKFSAVLLVTLCATGAALAQERNQAIAQAESVNVINACYSANNGQLRRVSSLSQCKSNETPLSWNITGPPGPKGDKGDKGDPGDSILADHFQEIRFSLKEGETQVIDVPKPNLHVRAETLAGGKSPTDVYVFSAFLYYDPDNNITAIFPGTGDGTPVSMVTPSNPTVPPNAIGVCATSQLLLGGKVEISRPVPAPGSSCAGGPEKINFVVRLWY